MFPIPYLFLKLNDGSTIPLPAGGVKKIAYTRALVQSSGTKRSMAILLNDGRLFTQGDNAWGECADGTTTPFYDHWNLAATGVADVFGVGMAFVAKYTDNSLKFAGNQVQLTGSGSNFTAWTNLPTTVSNVITGANLVEATGAAGNTLWKRTDGYFYGSGANTNGCLGSGNSNAVPTPRLISQTCVRAFALNNASSYLNASGVSYVSGSTNSIGGSGTADQTQTFITVNLGVSAYIKEWMTNESRSFAIASTGAADNVNYLYTRGYGANTGVYVKDTTFGSFTTFKVIDGGQSRFFIADNKLYALGAQPEVLGLGSTSTTQITTPTLVPVPTGQNWDLSKLTYILDIKPDSMVDGTAIAHWMVYDGNLFYTGTTNGFFNKTEVVNKFTNIPENFLIGSKATFINGGVIGAAVVGGSKKVPYTVDPAGATVSQMSYTSSDPTVMTVDSTGLMTFLKQGSFSAGISGLNSMGETLSDSSPGWAEDLSLYTHPTNPLAIGQTMQITYDIGPTNADKLPDMAMTFTTSDPTVATVDPTTGLVTAVGEGGCFVGTSANYQSGAATAINTAWLDVGEYFNLVNVSPNVTYSAPAGRFSYLGKTGKLTKATANTWDLSYDLSGNPLGRVTPEAATTNLLPYSSNVAASGGWGKTRIVHSTGFAAPDGSTEARKIGYTAVSGSHYLFTPITRNPGQVMTYSLFLKAAEYTRAAFRFDAAVNVAPVFVDLANKTILQTGDAANTKIVDVGGGWVRVSLTATASATGTVSNVYILGVDEGTLNQTFTGNGTGGIYFWGGQVEFNNRASSYVETAAGAPVTVDASSATVKKQNNAKFANFIYSDGSEVTVPVATTDTVVQIPLETKSWGERYLQKVEFYN